MDEQRTALLREGQVAEPVQSGCLLHRVARDSSSRAIARMDSACTSHWILPIVSGQRPESRCAEQQQRGVPAVRFRRRLPRTAQYWPPVYLVRRFTTSLVQSAADMVTTLFGVLIYRPLGMPAG